MDRIKVGIDVLSDVPGQSGQVNIHRNVLSLLPGLAPDMDFFVFSTNRLRTFYESYGIGAPNLYWVHCRFDNNDGTWFRMISQECEVPWYAQRLRLNAHLAYPLPFLFPLLETKTIYRHTLTPLSLTGSLIDKYRQLKIRFSASKSAAFFCNSIYSREELTRLVPTASKVNSVIWESFDSNIFCQTAVQDGERAVDTGLHEGEKFILVPTGLRPRKNSEVVFRTLDLMRRDGGEVPPVIFAGSNDSEYKRYLEGKYWRLFEDRLVVPLGFISHEELAWLGRRAVLSIYPSKIETFGVPPLEMMALGLPVLVSSAGPLPEISGPGAEIFDPDDHVELKYKVVTLLGSPEARDALARRGTEFVKRYSWARNAAETIDLIRKVLCH